MVKNTLLKLKKMPKKYMLILLACLFVFVVVLRASYGFFSTTVGSKDYIVYTGKLQVEYDSVNSNLVTLEDTYPLTNAQGLATTGSTFSVKNVGTILGKYQVRLELASDNEIPIEYIKMAYAKTQDESENIASPTYSEPVLLSDLNDSLVILKNEEVGVNKTDTINLKLWIDISAPDSIQNKVFKAKIVVDSIQQIADRYQVNTKPIIELNKDENGNIDYIIPLNSQYQELGVASVKDDKDLLKTTDVTITGSVNTSVVGSNTITYSITDSDSNTTTVTRTIYVGDTESLDIKTSISAVEASFTSAEKTGKEVIGCSHIYGANNSDMYLNCKLYTTFEDVFAGGAQNREDVGMQNGVVIAISSQDIIVESAVYIYGDIILELNGKSIKSSTWQNTSGNYGDSYNTLIPTDGAKLVVNDRITEHNNETGNDDYVGGIYAGYRGRAVYPYNGSSVIINGGNYTGRQAVLSGGNNNYVEINDGYYEGQFGAAIQTYSTNDRLVVNGGTFTNSSGSTATSAVIRIAGTGSRGVINSGTVIGTTGSSPAVDISTNANIILTINGGNFSSNYQTIKNSIGGTIIINDATVTSTGASTVQGGADGGTITINGGTFTGNSYAIYNNNVVTININGGTFSTTNSSSNPAIYNRREGVITIDGADITCGSNATIQNAGTGTINVKSGTIANTGSNSTLANSGNGNIYITGGTITASGSRAVRNSSNGNVYITQTVTPIYIANSGSGSSISNEYTGSLYITANQANACTATASATTSGLCVYNNVNSASSAIYIDADGGSAIINGGTYVSALGDAIVNYKDTDRDLTTEVRISNANLNSGRYGVSNVAVMKICNSTITTPGARDMNIYSGSTTQYYNVTFFNSANPSGTDTATANTGTTGTVTKLTDACPF